MKYVEMTPEQREQLRTAMENFGTAWHDLIRSLLGAMDRLRPVFEEVGAFDEAFRKRLDERLAQPAEEQDEWDRDTAEYIAQLREEQRDV